MFRLLSLLLAAVVSIFLSSPTFAADHQVLLQGGNRLAIVDPGGAISWEMPWGGIHDIHLLDNGNILTAEGKATVVEIDRESKQVVWRYDSATSNGNQGKRIEVHAFERLEQWQHDDRRVGHGANHRSRPPGQTAERDPFGVGSSQRTQRYTSGAKHCRTAPIWLPMKPMARYVNTIGTLAQVVWEYEVPMFGKDAKNGHGPEAFGNRLFAALRLTERKYVDRHWQRTRSVGRDPGKRNRLADTPE